MRASVRVSLVTCAVVLAASIGIAQNIPLNNWTVPALNASVFQTSPGIRPMEHIQGDVPGVFVPVQPCRLHDSRLTSGGPGPIPASTTRNYDFIPGGFVGTCISSFSSPVLALSLNFSVVNTQGPGFILAYPTGQPAPGVSVLNYAGTPGEVRNNAAIVPVDANGSFSVTAGVSGTDVIIDINGIFLNVLESGTFFHLLGDAQQVIFGENTRTDGFGTGVIGGHRGSGWGVLGYTQGATGITYGVRGTINSADDGAAAVSGQVGAFAGGFDPNVFNRAAFKAVSGDGNGLNAFVSGFSSGVSSHGSSATGVDLVNDAYLSWNEFFTFGMLTNGNVNIGGNLFVSGTKTFVQPHPTDASKQIKYISVEAPASEIYYRGTAQIQRGMTRVEVPESFRLVASPGSYATMVTPVGAMATVAVIQEDENGIVLQASRDVKVHYVVHGLRAGFEHEQAIEPNILFQPGFGDRYFKGLPAYHRRLLVQNQTLNTDGTPNRETASRLGWKLPPERTTTPE